MKPNLKLANSEESSEPVSHTNEFGIPEYTVNLPDSKVEVIMREPRLGDIRVAELDIQRLKTEIGEFDSESIHAVLPLLKQLIVKFGNKLATKKSNGLTAKPAMELEDFDTLTLGDVAALSSVMSNFRGYSNTESK